MSVIDKMLRDLDRRQSAGAGNKASAPEVDSSLSRGTLLVDAVGPGQEVAAKVSRPWQTVSVGLLLLLLLVLGGWWLKTGGHLPGRANESMLQPAPALPPSTQMPGANAPPVAVVSPSHASTLPPGKAEAAATKHAGEATVSSKKSGRVTTDLASVARDQPARAVPGGVSLPADMSLKMDSVLKEGLVGRAIPLTPLVDGGPILAMTVANPASATGAAARPASAMDALAQAQRLWSAGSRLPAMDLLNDALALLERTPSVSGSPGAGALAAVARELARMELAEGRVTQALEMLTRLQPVLANVADTWAMRGNAAQRLGRHEESVAAYRTALRLRPDEPRWMVGAAISLAAQGQISAATELAEKGRLGGALPRDIATYLQQLGVTLAER